MRQILATVLCVAMVTTGCASASGPRVAAAGPQPEAVDKTAMADYLQKIPAGSKVRVERTDGTSLRGTLMKASADSAVVQKHTRVPEPPVEVPITQIARVTVDNGGISTGRAVGIGVGVGAGVFLAILGIFAATFSD